MLRTQRVVITGVLIVVFFVLLLQCLHFIKAPETVKPFFESFTSAGPTRPDDCLCLPGYVPSNTKGDTLGGTIIRPPNGAWHFIPHGTRKGYWIPSCQPQGINIDFCRKYQPRDVKWNEFSSLIDSTSTLTASIWNEIHATTTTPTFFCQKLTDPSDTKACTVLSK